MKTLLDMQDLQKSFGQQLVLDRVGFRVEAGEIVGLIGPSGAGKSTMIKTMLGMEKADGGSALVLNHTMPNRQILGSIGYVAQSDALYEARYGQENLVFFAELKGLSKQDMAAEIAHVVDLSEHLDKPVSGYSGGMRRLRKSCIFWCEIGWHFWQKIKPSLRLSCKSSWSAIRSVRSKRSSGK